MLTGITLAETEEFKSALDDAPEDQKTVFMLGAIDVLARSVIEDNTTYWMQTENGMQVFNKAANRNFELCRFGIKGVKNFKDASGNDITVTFSQRVISGRQYQVASDDFIIKLPDRVISEIAMRLLEINSMSEQQRKKSPTP